MAAATQGMYDRDPVSTEPVEQAFAFLSDAEIRAMSAVAVTSPLAFSALGTPLRGGLYSPEMGPIAQDTRCVTCGKGYRDCLGGHPGHIRLYVPVYNPLLFASMFRLLRAKCLNCHRLKLGTQVALRKAHWKIRLLRCGRVEEALRLEQRVAAVLAAGKPPTDGEGEEEEFSVEEKVEELMGGAGAGGGGAGGNVSSTVKAGSWKEQMLDALYAEMEALCERTEHENQTNARSNAAARRPLCIPSGLAVEHIRQTLADVFRDAVSAKDCENCKAPSLQLRKDGVTKIFICAPSAKLRKALRKKDVKITAANWLVHGQGHSTNAPAGGHRKQLLLELHDDGEDGSGSAGGDRDGDIYGARRDPDRPSARQVRAQTDIYLTHVEVQAQLQLLYAHAEMQQFIGTLFSVDDRMLFFRQNVLVPPNVFRGAGGASTDKKPEHPQNTYLGKILLSNQRLAAIHLGQDASRVNMQNQTQLRHEQQHGVDSAAEGRDSVRLQQLTGDRLRAFITEWIELQNIVNGYVDNAKMAGSARDVSVPGVRQLLERKEGLFRSNMMGKRVNYACRSVISPDPYIATSEIGIPRRFAMTLTYPEPVTAMNVHELRQLVEGGSHVYPGANYVENARGRLTDLRHMSARARHGVAKMLLTEKGNKVWRHLRSGDMMLVNRQPTLHKPSIMAHVVRVLSNPSQQTIRMHYANCATYNADFDGDEINCHFPQNELARAEAAEVASTSQQYIVPTNGKPIRGLIQDHVDSGVKLTGKDTFLTLEEYQQLLYVAVSGLAGVGIVSDTSIVRTQTPAILKPKPMWTGKQVITGILKHLTEGRPSLFLTSSTKTPASAFGEDQEEHKVLVRHCELLRGILDKGQFGASEFGLVHAVQELYGGRIAGKLLNALARVLTVYLQSAGHTCGIEDLVLRAETGVRRRELIGHTLAGGERAMLHFVKSAAEGQRLDAVSKADLNPAPDGSIEPLDDDEAASVREQTAHLLSDDLEGGKAQIDSFMQGTLAQFSTDLIKACVPNGLIKHFPQNAFGLMVTTGAKGSNVNFSQVSCMLGQQALEGQRVPIMASGKSLPAFQPFDANPRAGGFITDRFLTGIRPQEYYFHCMAGREGLVDTAVKTSRSGYLQRCLIKHLEELRIHYDHTVRDAEGAVVQFLYGEDGVDPTMGKFLDGSKATLRFLAENVAAVSERVGWDPEIIKKNNLDLTTAEAAQRQLEMAERAVKRDTSACAAAGAAPGPRPIFQVGDVVQARKQRKGLNVWNRAAFDGLWHLAEIVRVRGGARKRKPVTYDIRYVGRPGADGAGVEDDDADAVLKHVPRFLRAAGSTSTESGAEVPLFEVLRPGLPDPLMHTLSINRNLGAVSERLQHRIADFLKSDGKACGLRQTDDEDDENGDDEGDDGHVSALGFKLMMGLKFIRSLAAPGEAVGCVAAQSVGEPSTQMTLNTFHLAGHGGANVTLGIPRLREIIMTASRAMKTPAMTVPLQPGRTMRDAQALARKWKRLSLEDLLHHDAGITVRERIVIGPSGLREREYSVTMRLQPMDVVERVYDIGFPAVAKAAVAKFCTNLKRQIVLELRRNQVLTGGLYFVVSGDGPDTVFDMDDDIEEDDGVASEPALRRNFRGADRADDGSDDDASDSGAATLTGKKRQRVTFATEVDDDSSDDNSSQGDADGERTKEDLEDQGSLRFGRKREISTYDESDEDGDDEENDEDDTSQPQRQKQKQKQAQNTAAEDDLIFGRDSDDEDGEEEEDMERGKGRGVSRFFDDDEAVESSSVEEEDSSGPTQRNSRRQSKTAAAKKNSRRKSKGNASSADGSTSFDWVTADPVLNELRVQLRIPASRRRLLMVGAVERACAATTVREKKGISNAFAVTVKVNGKDRPALQTEGVNFGAVWALDGTDCVARELSCNDVWQILQTYGVEAARNAIVHEIKSVFAVYGISVDERHLSLIADQMTFSGGYRAMNRIGMQETTSPLLQMTFETTTAFMTQAATIGLSDMLETPSARIIMGMVPRVGTGAFDLMVPTAAPPSPEGDAADRRM